MHTFVPMHSHLVFLCFLCDLQWNPVCNKQTKKTPSVDAPSDFIIIIIRQCNTGGTAGTAAPVQMWPVPPPSSLPTILAREVNCAPISLVLSHYVILLLHLNISLRTWWLQRDADSVLPFNILLLLCTSLFWTHFSRNQCDVKGGIQLLYFVRTMPWCTVNRAFPEKCIHLNTIAPHEAQLNHLPSYHWQNHLDKVKTLTPYSFKKVQHQSIVRVQLWVNVHMYSGYCYKMGELCCCWEEDCSNFICHQITILYEYDVHSYL